MKCFTFSNDNQGSNSNARNFCFHVFLVFQKVISFGKNVDFHLGLLYTENVEWNLFFRKKSVSKIKTHQVFENACELQKNIKQNISIALLSEP